MGDDEQTKDSDTEPVKDSDTEPVGDVTVFWRGEAAQAHGQDTTYGGIEWVAEYQDRIILVPREGRVEHPPRVTIYRKDICGFHEHNKHL